MKKSFMKKMVMGLTAAVAVFSFSAQAPAEAASSETDDIRALISDITRYANGSRSTRRDVLTNAAMRYVDKAISDSAEPRTRKSSSIFSDDEPGASSESRVSVDSDSGNFASEEPSGSSSVRRYNSSTSGGNFASEEPGATRRTSVKLTSTGNFSEDEPGAVRSHSSRNDDMAVYGGTSKRVAIEKADTGISIYGGASTGARVPVAEVSHTVVAYYEEDGTVWAEPKTVSSKVDVKALLKNAENGTSFLMDGPYVANLFATAAIDLNNEVTEAGKKKGMVVGVRETQGENIAPEAAETIAELFGDTIVRDLKVLQVEKKAFNNVVSDGQPEWMKWAEGLNHATSALRSIQSITKGDFWNGFFKNK